MSCIAPLIPSSMQCPVDCPLWFFTYGNYSIITRVFRGSSWSNRCTITHFLPCAKESFKKDGGSKNDVITHKVALTDKIEKTIWAWKVKWVCSTANKYKSKWDMKAIEEESKELEQKKKSCVTSLNCGWRCFS